MFVYIYIYIYIYIYLNNNFSSIYTYIYFNNNLSSNFSYYLFVHLYKAHESNTIDSGAIQINCIIINTTSENEKKDTFGLAEGPERS